MSNNSKNVSDFRKRRKLNLLKVCGEKCILCGYHKVSSALEFHHIDEEKKLYSISSTGNCHNLKSDLDEIKKCVLVCANCHREIHEGLHPKENLIKLQVFDEKIANELIQN